MIRRVVSLSLHQPLVVALAILLFVGGGLIAFRNLPVEAFPDRKALAAHCEAVVRRGLEGRL